MVALRRTLLVGIDDLLMVVREFICRTMSRSALDAWLRRHGVSSLRELLPKAAPRWAYHEILPDKSSASEAGFLERLVEACPLKITKVLTNNCSELSDRFIRGRERVPTSKRRL